VLALKTTCRDLGGPCDQELTAQTWDEMVKAMTAHMAKHPDTGMAKHKMHNDDPWKWARATKP
jgi:predicted small metal-binding protein